MEDHAKSTVVAITGASSGIGRALAIEYARRGNRVAMIARRREALEDTHARIVSRGGTAIAIASDVTDRDRISMSFTSIFDKWGTIDIMIANAGIGSTTDVRN